MTLDKTKLQKLLWAEAASFRADCADWQRNTEALQEFLGSKTVEEVALELLAENCRLRSDNETWRLSIEAERNGHNVTVRSLQAELDRLKGPAFDQELAALRKDAGRWRFFSTLANDLQAFPHSWGQMTPEKMDFMCDEAMAAAMGKGGQP
ncbi:hypothetical protein [Pseudomonas sp. RGM2987]|uniref:hypothetical protein n=1 Tax=Pseudomonas sp. RGM2987 TaxID=2930090 RepID=UPI001FD6AE76|nr:hypothetical protein [Pseudomonas sp. RGM2987]MCJ8207709.1 hypothetical protein [Pseudomonas sp. RGM2987]